MLDLVSLLVLWMLVSRAWRAREHRVPVKATDSSADARAGIAWFVIEDPDTRPSAPTEDAQPPPGAQRVTEDELDAAVRRTAEPWLFCTRAGSTVSSSLVRAACDLAESEGAAAVTMFPRPRIASLLAESISLAISQCLGDGADPKSLGRPDVRRAAGWDEFLLIRRSAHERIRDHRTVHPGGGWARSRVRDLKRAGLPVIVASGGELLAGPELLGPQVIREVLTRLHSALPGGAWMPFCMAALIVAIFLRPFGVLAGVLVHAPLASPTTIGLASATCVLVFVHRFLFDELMSVPHRSLGWHPVAMAAVAALAVVAGVQKALGRGPRFEPVGVDAPPDHAGGVDYRAVYTERYFDGVDSKFSPWGFRDDARYYDRLLEPVLKRLHEGRALDIGCGYGFLTRRLASRFRTTGLDVSVAAIARCRATVPGAEFLVHEVEQPFPVPDGSFDLATLTDVIEHVMDPERLIRNARRALAPGGVLYVTTPNLNGVRRWLYADADRREHHVSLMSRAALVGLLERCGFRVEESWTYMSAYLLPGRSQGDWWPETGVICRKVDP